MIIKAKNHDRFYLLLLFCLFLSIKMILAFSLSVPSSTDETALLSTTAYLAGDDWTVYNIENGFYFRPGMAIFLFPVYVLFKNNPFGLYKAALFVGNFLLSFTPCICFVILRDFFLVQKKRAFGISITCTSFSSILLHTNSISAEPGLVLFPWLILLVLLHMQGLSFRENKKRVFYTVILSILCALSLLFHTRGILFLFVVITYVIVEQIVFRNKVINWIAFILSCILFFTIVQITSNYLKAKTFQNCLSIHNRMQSFDSNFIRKLLTIHGIYYFFIMACGWCFNLITSTYGIILIGAVLSTIVIIRDSIYHKYSPSPERLISIFGLLILLSSLLAGLLFMYRYAYDLLTNQSFVRADRLAFGRYTICGIGIPSMLALLRLTDNENRSRQFGVLFAAISFVSISAIFLFKNAPSIENRLVNMRSIASIALFINRKGTSIDGFVLGEAILAVVTFIIFTIILLLSKLLKRGKSFIITSIIFFLSVASSMYVFPDIRITRNNNRVKQCNSILETFKKNNTINEICKQYPFVVKYKNDTPPDVLQFILPKWHVGSTHFMHMANQDCFLVVGSSESIDDIIHIDNPHFSAKEWYVLANNQMLDYKQDMLFINGNTLAKSLQENGVSLIKLD